MDSAQTENPIKTAIEIISTNIIQRLQPHKIILFGSHAYGTPTPDSDIDILVIMPDPLPRKEAWKISTELSHKCSQSVQIFFMSNVKFQETRDVVGGLGYPAHQWGKTLYATGT